MARNSKALAQHGQAKIFSNDAFVLVGSYILSIFAARFWPLSGWWLVVAFTIFTSCALAAVRYISGRSIRAILPVISVVLILLGLKLTSLGVGPAANIQSDGYNVTGGLIASAGGVLLGIWIASKEKPNGKK